MSREKELLNSIQRAKNVVDSVYVCAEIALHPNATAVEIDLLAQRIQHTIDDFKIKRNEQFGNHPDNLALT